MRLEDVCATGLDEGVEAEALLDDKIPVQIREWRQGLVAHLALLAPTRASQRRWRRRWIRQVGEEGRGEAAHHRNGGVVARGAGCERGHSGEEVVQQA